MGFVSSVPYYSPTYGLEYTNGYGYNFYYGQYGYYEYSINDSRSDGANVAAAVIAFCCLFMSCACCLFYGGK